MDLNIKGKTALVTASSKGLGKATAQALGQEGARVLICARNVAALEATEQSLADRKIDVRSLQCDLSRVEETQKLIQWVNEQGGADILVTNAGGPPAGFFEEFDDGAWREAFELTLMSAVRLIRGVLPSMRQKKWGRIINVTSIAAKEPVANLLLSNSMRAGVHGLAKTLAGQVAADGVTINNVLPGLTRTDRLEKLAEHQIGDSGRSVEEQLTQMGAALPPGRLGRPEEFAAVVAFLASDLASFVNGTSIPVDGGMLSGLF